MNFRDHVLGTFMVRCKVKTPKGSTIETEIPMLSEEEGGKFMTALNSAMVSPPPKVKSLPKKLRGRGTRTTLSGDEAQKFMGSGSLKNSATWTGVSTMPGTPCSPTWVIVSPPL